ncbi:hypothetical protein C0Q70_01991 [Pomacea canaliculata]|uniref:Sm domain-containing protein n=1 Tax=Pomacea canaliculata TaxID=400727 RepID=A0A2T7Q112_POMCA|nr:hypothetical protein C0Q70_01991 [Pomacea canaliculata]
MDDDSNEAGAFKTENSEALSCFKNIDFSSETFNPVAAIYSNDEFPDEDVDIYENVDEFLSVHIPSRKKSSAPSYTIPSCNTQILVDSETENAKEKEMVTVHEVTKKIKPVSFQSGVEKSGSIKVNKGAENSQEKKKTTIDDASQTSIPETIIKQSGSQQETVQIQDFKEDKGPVGHIHRSRKQRINVITQMENGFQQGPLSVLRRSVMEKLKVHVWTRSVRNIRGICTGFVVAFDKHMNMALMDVDEIYRKPVGKHKKESKVSKLLGVKTRKLLCRHLNQVLLRGDHVVAVALAEF